MNKMHSIFNIGKDYDGEENPVNMDTVNDVKLWMEETFPFLEVHTLRTNTGMCLYGSYHGLIIIDMFMYSDKLNEFDIMQDGYKYFDSLSSLKDCQTIILEYIQKYHSKIFKHWRGLYDVERAMKDKVVKYESDIVQLTEVLDEGLQTTLDKQLFTLTEHYKSRPYSNNYYEVDKEYYATYLKRKEDRCK